MDSTPTREELFQEYIETNNARLCSGTDVNQHLLTNLIQEGVLKFSQKGPILAPQVDYDRAVKLYEILARQVDDLPKILKVLRKTGDKQAVKILEDFSNQNPAPPQLTPPPPSYSQVSQKIGADAVILNPPAAYQNPPAAPATPTPRVERIPRAEIQVGGNLQQASSTSRDSYPPTPTSKASELIKKAASQLQQHYPTSAKYKGIALIVNVIHFENEPAANRQGAEKDTVQLTEVLLERHFLVYHLNDPTENAINAIKPLAYEDLRLAIEQCQNLTFENADSFLLAVMSHGDGESIITKDGKRFPIFKRILEQFNNVNAGEGLRGKPKIFIFNYCRGDVTDTGTGSTQRDAMPERVNPLTIPSWTDMLVCYSTLDGHYAYRDKNEGSWFIQTFCEVLRQYGERFDVNTLLNIVSEVMKSLESERGEKQICPYYNIGFTKKFYL